MSWRPLYTDHLIVKQALVDADFLAERARAVLLLLEIPSWWFESGFHDGSKLPRKKREHLVRLLIDGFWGGDLDFETSDEAAQVFAQIKSDPCRHPAYELWRRHQRVENDVMAEAL